MQKLLFSESKKNHNKECIEKFLDSYKNNILIYYNGYFVISDNLYIYVQLVTYLKIKLIK